MFEDLNYILLNIMNHLYLNQKKKNNIVKKNSLIKTHEKNTTNKNE